MWSIGEICRFKVCYISEEELYVMLEGCYVGCTQVGLSMLGRCI